MRKEKQLLLDDLVSKFGDVPAFIITGYRKMTANAMGEFRNLMAKEGNTFEVARKRVLMKAFNSVGVAVDAPVLEGHVGVVFANSNNILDTAKMITQYSQDNENVVSILGGWIEGKLYLAADVDTLSKLPGKDQMRAELLGLFEAPMAQTLAVMDALLTGPLHCIQQKSQQA